MLKKVVLISVPVVFLVSCASNPFQPREKQPLPENEYYDLVGEYSSFETCLDYGHIGSNDYGRARIILDNKVRNLSYKYLIDHSKLGAMKEAGKQEFDAHFSKVKKDSAEGRKFKNLCSKLAGVYNASYEQSNQAMRQQQPVVQPTPSITIDSPKTTICSGSSYGFGNYGSASAICNSF